MTTPISWHHDPDLAVAYPPQPWHLGGRLSLTLWRVPTADLPGTFTAAVPAGASPLAARGHTLVGTAFVRYQPGGVLSYDELLAAVPVRDGRGVAITIPAIWVDSRSSLAGGRRLWGIPKELAEFERAETPAGLRVTAGADGVPIASAAFTRGRTLPGRWTVRQRYAQHLDGRAHRSRSIGSSRLGLSSAGWEFTPGGPLGFLHGRRPLRSLEQHDLAITFGVDHAR
jgi:hypothetical protein